MGDRANVVLHEAADKRVFLYTHWGGSHLPETVRVALARRQRWDDPSYLGRIVFSEMIGDEETLKMETGFGISATVGDNSYPYLVIDAEKQEIRFEDEDDGSILAVHRFEDYVAQPRAEWPDEPQDQP